jgi:hypothetical protein
MTSPGLGKKDSHTSDGASPPGNDATAFGLTSMMQHNALLLSLCARLRGFKKLKKSFGHFR